MGRQENIFGCHCLGLFLRKEISRHVLLNVIDFCAESPTSHDPAVAVN
jgi:hypothetical protein